MSVRKSLYLLPVLCLLLLAADSPTPKRSINSDKKALSKLQDYVGAWRGVGQLRRGSNRGAWIEQSDWAWKFTDDEALLRFDSSKGKYFKQGALYPADKAGQYQLRATTADGDQKVKYTGSLSEDNKLVLIADDAVEGMPDRISIRLVAAGKRLVVLYERASGESRFARLAEVGYTRQGSNFGKGTSFVECVVTGGQGTIAVMHEGKTYYVCCTGCKDAFEDDPEGILAEYRQRKAEEKAGG